jgi:hypothetical protein
VVIWMLVGGSLVLVCGALWIAMLGRRGSPMRFTQPVPTGRVSVVLKTIPLQPAGGKTPSISPVVADARGTVHQLPPTGLAAWLVVYRDGMPCETLVLQTIGVTTIGREGSTKVDGKLLDGPIELRDNMWLQIGSTRLRFKCTA